MTAEERVIELEEALQDYIDYMLCGQYYDPTTFRDACALRDKDWRSS